MATATKNTKNTRSNPKLPTDEQMRATALTLVTAVTDADTFGKAAVKAATLESFAASVDALVKLGEYAATTLATKLEAGKSVTGDNIAALFGKDGALYPTDQAERDALKGKNVWGRGLRAYQLDSPAMRALFLDGPRDLIARNKDLAPVTGHNPGVVAYHEFLGVMNADKLGKNLEADFLAKFNIWRDAETGATLYAKRKPIAQTGAADKVSFKSADLPIAGKVIGAADRDALVALVDASRFDIDVSAADLPALTEYVLARYRLSLMEAPAEAPVAPAAKVKLSLS